MPVFVLTPRRPFAAGYHSKILPRARCEEGAMFVSFGAGFSSSDYTVWQHRPDLSLSED